MATKLNLTFASGDYEIVKSLKDGTVTADGIELNMLTGMDSSSRHWRMLRGMEFDVAELSASSYLMAKDRGLPLTAIPVFLHRRFRHGFIFINTGILLSADEEAELAGVLAHEIGHVTARHGTENQTKGTIINLATIPLIFLGGVAGFGIRQAELLSKDTPAPVVEQDLARWSAIDEVDAVLLVTSLTIKHFLFDEKHLKAIVQSARKPLIFYSFSIPTELAISSLTAAGVGATTNLPGTCSALLKLATPAPAGYGERLPPAPLGELVSVVVEVGDDLLCEYEVKRILARHGLAGPREILATSEASAVEAAGAIGYPVAMKVQSPLLPHKTEIGGVRLNVHSAAEALAAYRDLVAAARAHSDPARLRGVLIQPMAKKGHELIIGTVRDPAMGPLVLVGFGGVAVELYQDLCYRLAPVDRQGALAMLNSLKSAPLLKGFRAQRALDLVPIADLIALVSRIAWQLQDRIDEFELNPVIVHADNSGYTVADALMRRRPQASPARSEDNP